MYRKKNSERLKQYDFELLDIIINEIAIMHAYVLRQVGHEYYYQRM